MWLWCFFAARIWMLWFFLLYHLLFSYINWCWSCPHDEWLVLKRRIVSAECIWSKGHLRIFSNCGCIVSSTSGFESLTYRFLCLCESMMSKFSNGILHWLCSLQNLWQVKQLAFCTINIEDKLRVGILCYRLGFRVGNLIDLEINYMQLMVKMIIQEFYHHINLRNCMVYTLPLGLIRSTDILGKDNFISW